MILYTAVGVCALAAVSATEATGPPAPKQQAPSARLERAAPPQSPAAGMSREAEAYYQFMAGRFLESEGDVDGATKAYVEAIRLDPKSAEIRAELASLYARDNKIDEAVKQADLALASDPDNVTAHRVLGILYGSLARVDEGAGPLDAQAAGFAARAVEHLDAARRRSEVSDGALDMMLAQIYDRTGEYDKSIAVLTRLANDEPGRPEPVNLLLQAYERVGRPDEAVKLLESTAPEQPQFYARLGELYERRQRWPEAASAYERAVARNPKSVDLRTRLAVALLSGGGEGRAGRAVDVLQQLRQESPGDSRVIYLLAQAQRTAGQVDDSEKTARELMKVAPGALTGPYALALAFEARQQYRQVVETLGPATARPPSAGAGLEVTPLLVHLGFAHVELGEYDQALAVFERARAASPKNPAIDVYVLQVHVSARRFTEAIALARTLRAARPGDQRVTRLEADALRQSGKPDEGAALLAGALDANANDVTAYLALAEYRAQTGQFDAAMQVLDRAAAKFPSDPTVPFEAGAVLERQKKFGDAERKFREVLARDPLHAQALNYLGYMLADRGERLDEAIGYIKRALEVEPNNGSYLDSLGWAYFRQGRLELSEPCLRRASEQRVRGSAVQEHFGDLLFKLGRYDEAVTAWQRALAGDGQQVDRAAIDTKIRTAREKAQKR
jgi:tetratricopeptide (TPR) repeat protein